MICRICREDKSLDNFHKNKTNVTGFDYRCKSCRREEAKAGRENNYFVHYCRGKRSECKTKGFEFDLTPEFLEDIWTGICPVFGVEIERASQGRGSHHSAHLDRIDPSKGYLIGNVAWISGRANRIKYDATSEELRKIADWMEGVTTTADECKQVEPSGSKQGTPQQEKI